MTNIEKLKQIHFRPTYVKQQQNDRKTEHQMIRRFKLCIVDMQPTSRKAMLAAYINHTIPMIINNMVLLTGC